MELLIYMCVFLHIHQQQNLNKNWRPEMLKSEKKFGGQWTWHSRIYASSDQTCYVIVPLNWNRLKKLYIMQTEFYSDVDGVYNLPVTLSINERF